jgi:hypothetical protein
VQRPVHKLAIAYSGSVEENGWTEFVWSLQPDSLHCNVSSFATRTRFPLTAIPRKRYVVRVSASESLRSAAKRLLRAFQSKDLDASPD